MPSGKNKPAVCMVLIPYATNTKAVVLIAAVAAYIGIVVVQSAVPSEARRVLCTTPPGAVAANGVCPTVGAVTAREARET